MPALMGGINATIMAYGQTGSGKTYTIFGSNESDQQQVGGVGRHIPCGAEGLP